MKRHVFRGREYPANWSDLRAAVLKRGGNRCEWCGAENHKPHPRTKSMVVLTTAHVYQKTPDAVDLENLAALCQRCHLGHDAHQHVQRQRGVHPTPGQRQGRLI